MTVTQSERHVDRDLHRMTETQTGRHIDRDLYSMTDTQTGRHIDRDLYSMTDTQTERGVWTAKLNRQSKAEEKRGEWGREIEMPFFVMNH